MKPDRQLFSPQTVWCACWCNCEELSLWEHSINAMPSPHSLQHGLKQVPAGEGRALTLCTWRAAPLGRSRTA